MWVFNTRFLWPLKYFCIQLFVDKYHGSEFMHRLCFDVKANILILSLVDKNLTLTRLWNTFIQGIYQRKKNMSLKRVDSMLKSSRSKYWNIPNKTTLLTMIKSLPKVMTKSANRDKPPYQIDSYLLAKVEWVWKFKLWW